MSGMVHSLLPPKPPSGPHALERAVSSMRNRWREVFSRFRPLPPPPLTGDLRDTPAGIEPLRVSLPPCTILSSRLDATRVARCARGSAQRGCASSSFRPAAGRSTEHEAPAGLEQPLVQARQGPALDDQRQDQPAQESTEVVGDDPEEQLHRVDVEPVAGEVQWVASSPAVIHCAVVPRWL